MPVADRRQGHDGGSVNIRAPQQKTRFCCSLVGVLAGIVARSDIHVGRLLVLPKPNSKCWLWLMFGQLGLWLANVWSIGMADVSDVFGKVVDRTGTWGQDKRHGRDKSWL